LRHVSEMVTTNVKVSIETHHAAGIRFELLLLRVEADSLKRFLGQDPQSKTRA
jgi:hypothetical protein